MNLLQCMPDLDAQDCAALIFAPNQNSTRCLPYEAKELPLVPLQEAMIALEKLGQILPVYEKLKKCAARLQR